MSNHMQHYSLLAVFQVSLVSQFIVGFATCYGWTYPPNLKSLSPPTMKIQKAIENIKNGVVWGS